MEATRFTSPSRGHWIVILVAAALAPFVLAGVFFTVGIPDVVDQVKESTTAAMLRHHPTRDDVLERLKLIHARWHRGDGFDGAKAPFMAFEEEPYGRCSHACDTALQAEFVGMTRLCWMNGDVVTMQFDRRGRLASWTTTETGDGC